MKKLNVFLFIFVLYIIFPMQIFAGSEIKWQKEWSDKVFKTAKKQNKLILLDLEAVWCHWCHVMHEETYSDPSVAEFINKNFIPVRIDHDSRLDLANKYRKYGWPATIVFNSEGNELLMRSGFIPSDELKIELKRIIEEPIPLKAEFDESKIKFSSKPKLSLALKELLIENHKNTYDSEVGGLNLYQKYIDRDCVEYSLLEALEGNAEEEDMARTTLNSSLKLIDPVWGGVYQYSTMGDWDYPHFEKLGFLQGEYIRIYSLAFSVLNEPVYLKASKSIYKYLKNFLSSPDGVFYSSQDADVVQGKHSAEYFALGNKKRREQGIPQIDKNIYTNQNGQIINGLVSLYEITKSKKYLNDAIIATNWILKNRCIGCNFSQTLEWVFEDSEQIFNRVKWVLYNFALSEQGFKHGKKDSAGPFLNDTLNMGLAFLSLYEATKEKKWLTLSEQSARFIIRNFWAPQAGFLTASPSCKVCATSLPVRRIDENIFLARFASNLYSKTGDVTYKKIAEHSLKYLVTPEIVTSTVTEPGILIAEREYVESLMSV